MGFMEHIDVELMEEMEEFGFDDFEVMRKFEEYLDGIGEGQEDY